VAKEKKRKKETSAVKYNTSGHYCGQRYNYHIITAAASFVVLNKF